MSVYLPEFTFDVKNLGSIREGSFTHKPLTIFCGRNNSGKTWAMYSLYHFYERYQDLRDDGDDLIEDNDEKPSLSEFNEAMSRSLWFLFNTKSEQLEQAEFNLLAGQDWLERSRSVGDAFLMPAERSGLHLFFRELSTRRTALLHHASRDNIDIGELLRDVINSRYALPIADYINWLNSMTEIQRSKSEEFHPHAESLKRGLVRGSYSVDRSTGNIEFKPYQARRDGRRTAAMGLHMTSSVVKSLFGLWFYLEHQAKPGGILMIDEPELNIHPENQLRIARLLARLVNAGLNVVISTHSDYIIREFNSLIMLGENESKELQKKHKYAGDELLHLDKIGAYLFDEQTITPFQITPDDGIYATTFDEVIKDSNSVNNDIYYSIQEKIESRIDD